jgi:hypothetical protein
MAWSQHHGRLLSLIISTLESIGDVPRDLAVRSIWPQLFAEKMTMRTHVKATKRAIWPGVSYKLH